MNVGLWGKLILCQVGSHKICIQIGHRTLTIEVQIKFKSRLAVWKEFKMWSLPLQAGFPPCVSQWSNAMG